MTKTTHLRKYDVIMMVENTTEEDIVADSKNLPSDVHLVEFKQDGNTVIDAVRAFKMSDIFDAYYDFGITEIVGIVSGYGSIKPKLFNTDKNKEE